MALRKTVYNTTLVAGEGYFQIMSVLFIEITLVLKIIHMNFLYVWFCLQYNNLLGLHLFIM